MKWRKKGLIFEPSCEQEWNVTHAAVPFADNIGGGLYRVYFSGRDELNRSQTGFFEIEINGSEKVRYINDSAILKVGERGAFDDSGAMVSWVVNYSERKYMYYTGWNVGITIPFRNSIGLAISYDGGDTYIKKYTGPILDRNPEDPYFVANPCVLIEGNLWRMWYLSGVGWDLAEEGVVPRYNIKYAESPDGMRWSPTGIVCIDFKQTDEYAISRPCVIKDGSIYKMWYSYRGKRYRIGYAESGDGIRWQRKDEDVGISPSEVGWDCEMVAYAFIFDMKGQRYMLYNGNGYGRTGIGLAILAENK